MGTRFVVAAVLATSSMMASACSGGASATESQEPTPPPAEREADQVKAIADALNEYGPATHRCWARAAADGYQVEGTVELELTLGPRGRDASVAVQSDTTEDPVLSDCLVELWKDHPWPDVFEAGDVIRLPPFEFVAPDAQYTVHSEDVPVFELAGGKLAVKVLVDEANTGNGDASMSELVLSGGMEVPMHTHSSAELLFALAGSGKVRWASSEEPVEVGTAIYIPAGVPHGFVHEGQTPIELLQLYAPGGPEGRFKDPAVTAGTSPYEGGASEARGTVRQVMDVPPTIIKPRQANVRIVMEQAATGDEAAYLGALVAEPGMLVPLHTHEGSSEYLYVLEGRATMSVNGVELPVQAGDAVQIPKGLEHSARMVGESTFKALQFYGPAGPEQRFKAASK